MRRSIVEAIFGSEAAFEKALIVVLLCFGAFGGCTSCAHSATLTLTGTAPDQDNAGSCTAPQLTPMLFSNVLRIQLDITGPQAVRDSLTVTAGQPWSWARNLPAGTYTIRCWAADVGGAGCDTTVTKVLKNQPWKVRL